ncbi:MAG: division/cell wall cluster transcriptional repressor MraZ [Anaerolineae bacterium]
MFLGEFKHTIDEKGRVTIPAKFRARLMEGAVVTRGLGAHTCLFVYPIDEWMKLTEKINSQDLSQEKADALSYFIYGNASDCKPDRQGRILIPANLRKYAGFESEIVIVGLLTHFAIWSQENWQEAQLKIEQTGKSIVKDLPSLMRSVAGVGRE